MKNFILLLGVILLATYCMQGCSKKQEPKKIEIKEEFRPLAPKDMELMRMMWFDGCMAGSINAVVGITGVDPQKVNVMFLGDVCSQIAKEVFKLKPQQPQKDLQI